MSPYIAQTRRGDFGVLLEEIKSTRIDNPGEVVYLFCKIADIYLSQHLMEFARMNDIMGALESAKADFIRNVLGPYEVKKQTERGDVWTEWGNT